MRGEIEFEGRRVSPMSPEMAAALGISISYQHPAILDDLSVLENLRVALPQSVFEGRRVRGAASEMLSALGLEVPLRTRSDSLTVAQKQLLEIAKALAMAAQGADSRRADSFARPGLDRIAVRPHSRGGQDRNIGHLHHPSPRGGSSDRATRHSASRRPRAGRGARVRGVRRKSPEDDRWSRARIDVSTEGEGRFEGRQLDRSVS